MNDKKAAKKIIKIAKKQSLVTITEDDVKYAKLIRRKLKNQNKSPK